MAALPATGAFSDTDKYTLLADAQEYTIGRIASIAPKVLYGAPQQLTTNDGGLTFTFGVDDNDEPVMPIGRATIYDSLNAIPGGAWVPNVDYLDEGYQIRMANNRSYTGNLYWYGIQTPNRIDGTGNNEPVLFPHHARILYVIKAVADFTEYRNPALSDRMLVRYEREFGQVMTELRKHFASGGAMGQLTIPWSPALVPTFMPTLS